MYVDFESSERWAPTAGGRLSANGGIGQGRVQMLRLRKAHFGEVTVTVWPKDLHKVCEKHNIYVLK